MPRPLPVALRQRVVDAHNNGEGTYAELAERFSVGEASVSRWLRKAREGDLTPGVRGPMAPEQRMLKPEHLEFLRETLEAILDSTGAELAAALEEVFGLKVSVATANRTRRRLGFTPKRGNNAR